MIETPTPQKQLQIERSPELQIRYGIPLENYPAAITGLLSVYDELKATIIKDPMEAAREVAAQSFISLNNTLSTAGCDPDTVKITRTDFDPVKKLFTALAMGRIAETDPNIYYALVRGNIINALQRLNITYRSEVQHNNPVFNIQD